MRKQEMNKHNWTDDDVHMVRRLSPSIFQKNKGSGMMTKISGRIAGALFVASMFAGCATSGASDATSGGLSTENLQQIVDTAQGAIEGTAFASTGVGGACVVILGLISAGLGWYARKMADKADAEANESGKESE